MTDRLISFILDTFAWSFDAGIMWIWSAVEDSPQRFIGF